jgi:hypothetical protein
MPVLVIARAQAVLDRVMPLIQRGGIDAVSAVSDDDAITRLESGEITALVIGGGVEEQSRQRLRSLADSMGTRVIDGALRGKDPEEYVRDELLPTLQRLTK